jgi:hypothetical protein
MGAAAGVQRYFIPRRATPRSGAPRLKAFEVATSSPHASFETNFRASTSFLAGFELKRRGWPGRARP